MKKLGRLFESITVELLFQFTYVVYGTFNVLVVLTQKGANVVDDCQLCAGDSRIVP